MRIERCRKKLRASHDWEERTSPTDNDPDYGADGYVIPALPAFGFERIPQEEASLNANACEERNACVHVEVLQVKTQQTERTLKGPGMVYIVIDSQRQGEHMGQVRRGQIYHENDCLVFLVDEPA
ncbi:hypothetical protein NDU88_002491 [Pleurodeles waltl]|uniref:Uncharacterized protein n=1 Tax=Pleurodeles waltl TaxID=8319 RepID=A0AAV7VBC8_PLEWA|nr:hypothetical protein NDU88_002491 [Pleurodeles waltl]